METSMPSPSSRTKWRDDLVPEQRQSLSMGRRLWILFAALVAVLVTITVVVGLAVQSGDSTCPGNRTHGGVSSRCQ
jgi:hypothetical protein